MPSYFKDGIGRYIIDIEQSKQRLEDIPESDYRNEFKYARQYGKVFDPIIECVGTDNSICELGVGAGFSHMRWSKIFSKKIIGLELDDPVEDNKEFSKFVPEVDQNPNQNAFSQYQKFQYRYRNLPPELKSRFDIRYKTDAFDENNARQVMHDYPGLKIINNDSKHRPYAFKLFQEAWEPHMHKDGILIQEDFARVPCSNENTEKEIAHRKFLQTGIENGWRVFSFRDVTEFNLPEETEQYKDSSLIGIYYKNTSMWQGIFDHLKQYEITLDNIDDMLYTVDEFRQIMKENQE